MEIMFLHHRLSLSLLLGLKYSLHVEERSAVSLWTERSLFIGTAKRQGTYANL